MLRDFWEWLKGKKTYITAAVMFLLAGARATEFLSVEQYTAIIDALIALGFIAVRHGIKTESKGG